MRRGRDAVAGTFPGAMRESATSVVELVVASLLLATVVAAFVPSALAVGRAAALAEAASGALASADVLERRVGSVVRATDTVVTAAPDRLVLRIADGGAPPGSGAMLVTFAFVDGRLTEERTVDGPPAATPLSDTVRTVVPDALGWRFAYRTWDGREVDTVVTDGAASGPRQHAVLVRLLAPDGNAGVSSTARQVGAWSTRIGDGP